MRIAPEVVSRVAVMLEEAAKRNAPPVKVWVTQRDERVRPSHRDADGQAVPANLRFILRKANGSGHDLARDPRDPNLPEANRILCRCVDPEVPQLLSESIHTTPTTVQGNRVSASVETKFPRAAESEFGGDGDQGAYYMTNALHEVAVRLGQGQTR